ncbi:hypothetical protein SAMN05192583_2254 [Sphingomonas gellani]|uniref:ATPase n=1 Tax=Sphingomonas gellani TaxID=1166340 RepID=A0A1H8EPE5_9SPHN|nr:hypothetical protein [Sphingomonas gellani]SEN21322.1 hypothetical protein SAMN05192583_2254 [Sphingomonas gellani]
MSAWANARDGDANTQEGLGQSRPDPADGFASESTGFAHEGPVNGAHWVAPAAAAALAVLWIGIALWLVRAEWAGLTRVAAVEFIAALAVVPALIGIAWLLAQRTSRVEQRRFARTAAAMRAQAGALERSAAAARQILSENRAALAEQIELMTSASNVAAGRFADLGRRLAEDIAEIDGHAHILAESTSGTQSSLSVLLASLPRAKAETEDATRLLERAGLLASEHAAALHAQLVALADRGREADAVAGGAAQKLAAHITRMEATSETAGARLESVTGEMSTAVDALLDRTADAVDEARKGIAAQGDAMLAMIGASQAALGSAARDSADTLATRIASVEQTIDRVTTLLERQRVAGDSIVGELDNGLARVEGRLDTLHRQGVERSQMLAASISALGGSADAMTEALRAGETMATRTIGTTESLLIALDAAAREIDETLPDALSRLDARVTASRSVVGQAKPELLALVTAAESTHDAIEAIADVMAEQRRTADTLSGTLLDTLNAGRGKADQLGHMVDETIGRANRFAEEAAPRLVEALLRVRDTATVAAERARETLATVIPEAAQALGTASGDAMRRATSETVEAQISALSRATDTAVAASERAAERLAGHINTIADQTALVESRLEVARAEREEADSNTFARRVSLLIEALNSASIDITKSYAPDISDSAWAAYLKGDRGVFTRRAVKVIDAAVARDVARLYDDNVMFREQVNRYIHDFEAMLRTVLAQPEGSPIGVTLLSSDMGKLYVALAQAIERLR